MWSGEPPAWWPEGEPWPPARRRRPWRRFGCLFGLVFFIGFLGLLAIVASIGGAIVSAPGLIGHGIRITTALVALVLVLTLVRAGRTVRGSGDVLDDLVEQAGRVEAGDYTARVDVPDRAPGPVQDLVRGFNTMVARLAADEEGRRSLLADVTHELRTPLTVISGNVEAILDGVHPADEAHLGVILEETRVLSRLVEDLRTLALSEAGSLSLHREPTDLDVLMTDVATSAAVAAGSAGVMVSATVDDGVPLLDVDPVRIREVLGNLVANALRHTPTGGRIDLHARLDGPLAEITVADTGTGIDPDLLPHVFERFARGTGSTGSGLGLSIARGLVELHGGTIAAESPAAGGTTIRIRLPVKGR